MFGFLEYFVNFSIVVFAYKIKSRRLLLKTVAIFFNFVVKTTLIWLVLSGFFCVFSQSEAICNLHSCYKFCIRVTSFALVLQIKELHSFLSQSQLSNFFVYIIMGFNNIHEKITQFWLAEKRVQLFSNTSAKLVTQVQITNGFWLAENTKETTKNQSD